MRDHVVFYLNGARQVVRGADALLSLSDFLRRRCGLIGTKIVCSEGDCGACTVLVGRPTAEWDRFVYRPIDSCIAFVFQFDGAHVVTVEGLRPVGQLNGVQQAMVNCHGSQCGFCTPGFVMAMTGLLEADCELDESDWRHGLTGNLCRCTGYVPILDAAEKSCAGERQRLNDIYPADAILAGLAPYASNAIVLEASSHRAACPATLSDALAFLAAHPDAAIFAGATDVGVRANKTGRLPATILDLNRVAELDFVRVDDGEVVAGSRATWSSLLAAISSPPHWKGGARGGIPDHHFNGEHCPAAEPLSQSLPSGERDLVPEFALILAVFGAPQIRHVGTIGGNIANASPIADSLPFLYVMDATLTLASSTGRREVNINNFYRGYKQLDLRPGELIADVRIPLPAAGDQLRLYKVSRRRDLDISTFTAAIRLRLSAETIEHATIALGGVGPTVLRARLAEQFLVGQPFTEETMRIAGDLADDEITPITDVRGAADYRRQLARNVFLKFYHQCQTDLALA